MAERKTPKVSVLLISYNGRAPLLKRAVTSVLKQNYKNWELIIQDDCSTDGSFNLIKTLGQADPRIKVYRNETNLGISKNRLAAYGNATGELICHLDNDDFLYAHALGYMAATFVQNPEIGFAYSDQAFVDGEGRPFEYVAPTWIGLVKMAIYSCR